MNCYTYNDLKIGKSESFSVEVSQDMMDHFRSITGDINPLHLEPEYAIQMGYKTNVVYGMLTSSFFSTLAGVYLPGKYSLIHLVETEFVKPVYIGDILTVKGTIKEKNDIFKTVMLKVEIFNSESIKVCRGKMRIGLLK